MAHAGLFGPPRPVLRRAAVLTLLLSLPSCSSSGSGPTEPSVAAELVGSWTAREMHLTSQENEEVTIDVIGDAGGAFELTIEASGAYEAVLTAFGDTRVESGHAETSGSTITLDPEPGAPATGTWTLIGGTLTIDTESSFDFNGDQLSEPAFLLLVMERS